MFDKSRSKSLLPDPTDLRELLVAELEYLKDQPGILAENKDLFNNQYRDLKSSKKHNWKLNIDPNWVIQIGGSPTDGSESTSRDFDKEGFALIGGLIEVEDGSFKEYALNLTLLAQRATEVRSGDGSVYTGTPCCWKELKSDDWRVAKRYHFDIDVDDVDSDDKHVSRPVTHLQSGGEFKEKYLPSRRAYLSPHYCSTSLDKPRLPHPPMDPVLLIQLLIQQYHSLRKLVQDSWASQVKSSERTLWKNYYSRIHQLLEEDKSSRATVDTLFDHRT